MKTARWNYAVPVRGPLVTAPLVFFSILAAIALALSVWRLFGGLAFTGMNDDYAIGVWKTFNVITLTALGSSALAVGMTTWIFNQRQLHVVMRAALTSSILFYGTGMFALGFDVGRPWNFYHVILPWNWNLHSALLEVSVCMTAYVAIFLLYENLPAVLPKRWFDRIKPLYPYMVAAAFLLPAMHQSSLGSLMVIAGTKVHPLWQTQMLPAFYLMQAVVCGFASLIIILIVACLAWKRPLDVPILATLAKFMAWSSIVFVVARLADVVIRGRLGLAFAPDWYSVLFHGENLFVLVPTLVLLNNRLRHIPRVLFLGAAATAIGGLVYRFSPTTLAFRYGRSSIYFPSTEELLMCVGYIGLAIALFILVVRRFAILPDRIPDWCRAMSKRITIDPITRIEGHLRIDVEVDQGKVQKACASSTMFRGIERILLGRDPREAWLFTQRFCGVCTTVHALVSVRAVEDALDLEIPLNAQYIRNLILIAHALHDHVVHFYQLSALDWVDVTQVLKADPKKASSIAESLSDWTDNSEKQMAAVRQRVAGLVGPAHRTPSSDRCARLLGTSGHEASAGDQPHRRLALPAGARVPALLQPGRGHARRQDPAHPERRRRRRGQRHQPRERGRPERGPPLPDESAPRGRSSPSSRTSTSPTSARLPASIPTGSLTAPA